MSRLKIAQVAPLYESVPPKSYGGTERVVSYITEELVAEGHEVTLYASGDSITRARLRSPCKRSLRLDRECVDQTAHHILLLEKVASEARRFDIVHFHIDYLHYPLSRRLGLPSVTTLHGRLDIPDLIPLYEEFRDMPVVSISDAQREPLPWINWKTTVYHGIPQDLHEFREGPGDHLAFLGRTSPEKGVDRAIEIARRAGRRLLIAAKVDEADREHFETELRPLIEQPGVEFIQEIGEDQKGDFLGNAIALLFPIDWPEPFGLVMIEALACGTPVVAYRAFWSKELKSYALALDGEKRPCLVRSSNAGQCLFTGIASPRRARRVADMLLGDDLFSGWGSGQSPPRRSATTRCPTTTAPSGPTTTR